MADPYIAGVSITLLEQTGGRFSASVSSDTLDSGLASVTALGAEAFYLTLGGTISDRATFFTMANTIDAARENKTTIYVANVDAVLDGNYYVTGFDFQRNNTNWVFTINLIRAAF